MHRRLNPVRRRILQGLAYVSASGTSGISAVIAADFDDGEFRHFAATLTALARHLFPHEGLPVEYYEVISNDILQRAAGDSTLAMLVKQGIAELEQGNGADWIERSEAEQIEGITRIADGRFFELMRRTTIEHLYRNKAVWELIGYEGSSVEFGGYVERGFDDIAWLPEASDAQ